MDVVREVTYRRTPRGAALYTCQWRAAPGSPPAPAPKAALLFLSGYNSYMSFNHDWLAGFLVAQGIAVYGVDHHGFGRSTQAAEAHLPTTPLQALRSALCCFGRQAYIPSFAGLVEDAAHVLRCVAAREPGLPLFVLAESMGGTVALEAAALLAAASAPLQLHLLLLAPMCSLGKAVAVSPVLVALGRALAALAPLAPTPMLKDTAAQHVKAPERLAEVQADPLRWQARVRLGTAFALKEASAAAGRRARLYAPASLLLLHGSADTMCPLEGSLALLAASPARDKTLLEYSGALHTLWAEPVATRRLLLADVLRHVAERAPGVAGVPEGVAGEGGSVAPALREAALREGSAAPGGFLHLKRPEGTGVFSDHSPFTALQHRPGGGGDAGAASARGAASVH